MVRLEIEHEINFTVILINFL